MGAGNSKSDKKIVPKESAVRESLERFNEINKEWNQLNSETLVPNHILEAQERQLQQFKSPVKSA